MRHTTMYKNFLAANPNYCPYVTGLTLEQFGRPTKIFSTFYVPKKKNPINGKEAYFSDPREALFFILYYYKNYPTFRSLGVAFGFAHRIGHDSVKYIRPFLKMALLEESAIANTVFGSQAEMDAAFEGVGGLIIDGTEIPTDRPSDRELQEERYSGKKNGIH